MKSTSPTVAIVCWLDAMMEGHWQSGTPDPDDSLLVYTTGWLIFESKERLVMVQSLTDGGYGNAIHIPRGMVRSIQRIQSE